MVLYVLAAEKTSCHNKPFEAIQTSNDCLERNVRYKEAGRLHARSVLKTILVQNFSSMLGFSSLRNLKILGNWHLVTLSSDPLTNLNCSKRFVFRRKLQVSASCRVGIGSDCVLFPYFDRRRRIETCVRSSFLQIVFAAWSSNLVTCSFQICGNLRSGVGVAEAKHHQHHHHV